MEKRFLFFVICVVSWAVAQEKPLASNESWTLPSNDQEVWGVLQKTVKENPRLAVERARNIYEVEQDYMYYLKNNDLEPLAQTIQKLPPAWSPNELLVQVAEFFGQKDVQSGLKWADTLPSGILKARCLSRMLIHRGEEAPLEALLLADKITEPLIYNKTIEPILKSWLKYDHAAARTWIEKSNIPSQLKDRLLKSQSQ